MKRSIYYDLSIGRPQNTKEKKEGFYKAASETNQIIRKGLAMRLIAVSPCRWWKFPDKGSIIFNVLRENLSIYNIVLQNYLLRMKPQ